MKILTFRFLLYLIHFSNLYLFFNFFFSSNLRMRKGSSLVLMSLQAALVIRGLDSSQTWKHWKIAINKRNLTNTSLKHRLWYLQGLFFRNVTPRIYRGKPNFLFLCRKILNCTFKHVFVYFCYFYRFMKEVIFFNPVFCYPFLCTPRSLQSTVLVWTWLNLKAIL